jgi:hypothetical protein
MFPAVVLAALVFCTSVLAGTSGLVVSPQEDLGKWNNMSRLSLAGTYHVQEREVTLQGANTVVEVKNVLAHIGLDLTDWLSVVGTVGRNRLYPRGRDRYDDMRDVWGAGLELRTLEHDITAPELMKGKISFLLQGQYFDMDAGDGNSEIKWEEVLVDLKLRYELFAFGDGEDTVRLPYSTVFFLGPVWSDIRGDLESRHDVGVVTGVAAFVTPNISLAWELQFYEKATHTLALGYHF